MPLPESLTKEQFEFQSQFDNWLSLENACCDDVNEVLNLLDKEDGSQTLRRAFIRASWVYIEAVNAGLIALVNTAYSIERKNYYLIKERDNVCNRSKKLLKAGCKLLCPGWGPDFSTQEWERFLASNGKRDVLMHPKEPQHLEVTDTDLDIAKSAIGWFIATTNMMKKRAMDRIVEPLA